MTFYIYLLQTYPPDKRYRKSLVLYAPIELQQGINRVLDNLLLRH